MSTFPYFLALAAIISFGLVWVVSWREDARSGVLGVLAALGIACACLAYMPQLDTFKAFSVEVRLRNTLTKADEVLSRLRELSLLNGKIAYRIASQAIILGSDDGEQSQPGLDEVDKELAPLSLTREERRSLNRPYLDAIGLRLQTILINIAEELARIKSENNVDKNTDNKKRLDIYSSYIFKQNSLPFNGDGDWNRVVQVANQIDEFLLPNERIKWDRFVDELNRQYKNATETGRIDDTLSSTLKKFTREPNSFSKFAKQLVAER